MRKILYILLFVLSFSFFTPVVHAQTKAQERAAKAKLRAERRVARLRRLELRRQRRERRLLRLRRRKLRRQRLLLLRLRRQRQRHLRLKSG